jgi:hypothetical protein
MRSAAVRVTIGALAWIALGAAGYFLFQSEEQVGQNTASLRTFDLRARQATEALVEARVAQQAYVAAGQGIGFWMPKVSANIESAQSALAAMLESATAAAKTPIEQAAATVTEFSNIEKRVREYLKSGQPLMAGDVIFSEGTDAASTAGRQIETAREAEHQAFDVALAAMRKQQATVGAGAAGVAALMVLLLVPVGRKLRMEEPADTGLSIAPSAAPAPAASAPPEQAAFKAAAALATEFGRVRDVEDLKRLLARAADTMDASGLMVWMGTPTGADLRPVLSHGYKADVLARIPPVPRSADNAAAAAYRSGRLQIVLGRPGGSAGAVVAPILSADGCVGALSAEIRHRAETSEAVQALAEIVAAHLAGVLSQTTPAGDISEQKAAQAL